VTAADRNGTRRRTGPRIKPAQHISTTFTTTDLFLILRAFKEAVSTTQIMSGKIIMSGQNLRIRKELVVAYFRVYSGVRSGK
jgi:hypothetical protein